MSGAFLHIHLYMYYIYVAFGPLVIQADYYPNTPPQDGGLGGGKFVVLGVFHDLGFLHL